MLNKFFMQLKCIKYKNLTMKAHFKLLQIIVRMASDNKFSTNERLELINRSQKLSKEFDEVYSYVKEICDKRIKGDVE